VVCCTCPLVTTVFGGKYHLSVRAAVTILLVYLKGNTLHVYIYILIDVAVLTLLELGFFHWFTPLLSRPVMGLICCGSVGIARVMLSTRHHMALVRPRCLSQRPRSRVRDGSITGTAGLKPAEGMYVCMLRALCVVRLRSLRWADHWSRGVQPSVVCLSVSVKSR
jgi:hypothetical protein